MTPFKEAKDNVIVQTISQRAEGCCSRGITMIGESKSSTMSVRLGDLWHPTFFNSEHQPRR